jgi:hypothetical protein
MALSLDPTKGKVFQRKIKISRDDIDDQKWRYLGMHNNGTTFLFFEKDQEVMSWSCSNKEGSIYK